MYSITPGIWAGEDEDRPFLPNGFRPVQTAEEALIQIHAGRSVFLPASDWEIMSRKVLIGLGMPASWADTVIHDTVEYRRVPKVVISAA